MAFKVIQGEKKSHNRNCVCPDSLALVGELRVGWCRITNR